MFKATLTSKGQVTIPMALRQRLDLNAGDRLTFELQGGGFRAQVQKQHLTDELLGMLSSKVRYPGRKQERQIAARALGKKYR